MSENFPHYSNNGCTLHELLKLRPDGAFWCYKTLPLTYDDSLSYYEAMCKNISLISKSMTDDVQHIEDMINCMTEFIQNMQDHLNQFIDDYNSNIARIDGELVRIDNTFSEYFKKDGSVPMEGDINLSSHNIINANSININNSALTSQTNLVLSNNNTNTVSISDSLVSFIRHLDMKGNNIINLGEPLNDTQAANRKYVDDKVAALGTVLEYKGTKPDIASLPTSGNKAGDVWYVESEKSAYAWVIDTANPTGHWEEFGPPINLEPYFKKDGSVAMTGDLDMGSHKVTAVSEPTEATDGATKGYVDTTANNYVLKTGDTISGIINFNNNNNNNTIKIFNGRKDSTNINSYLKLISNNNSDEYIELNNQSIYFNNNRGIIYGLAYPSRDSQATTKYYVDQRSLPTGGTAGQVLSKVDSTDFNTQWTTPSGGGGGGLQPVTVTRDEAYISTPTNTNTTKVLADPTAPPERPINKDQIAVYSETNQTYAENDVTGTLLVADPHSAMEAVNKRTLDGYLTKANIDDENERITSVKGRNPGTEQYHILNTNPPENIVSDTVPIFINCPNETTQAILPVRRLGYVRNSDKNILAGIKIDLNHIQLATNYSQYPNTEFPSIDLNINNNMPSININAKIIRIDSKIMMTSLTDDNTIITGIATASIQHNKDVVNKEYVDTNFIKVEGTPQEGSTIAFKNGKWTVVDHTTWNPLG